MKNRNRSNAGYNHRLLHLMTLCSLAIAQPLLGIIAENGEFLVARKVSLFDILLLPLLLILFLPMAFYLSERIVGFISDRISNYLHLVYIGSLAGLLGLLFLNGIESLKILPLILLTIIVGVGFAGVYRNLQVIRMFCSYMSPAIVLIPLSFLISPQISRIAENSTLNETGPGTVANNIPVVMLILDELPILSLLDENLEIDRIRYPNFAALADNSHWFRNAKTLSSATVNAVPTILSGIHDGDALPIAADYPQNLFSLLKPSHELEITEIVTRLSPDGNNTGRERTAGSNMRMQSFLMDLSIVYLHLIAPDEFRSNLPVISQSWGNFSDQRTDKMASTEIDWAQFEGTRANEFGEFIESIDRSDPTSLYFYHALLPHMPWEFLPSGKVYSLDGNKVPGLDVVNDRWQDNIYLVQQAYQRHLLQLVYVDKLLGQLTDRLKREGLYDESLIVLASDHGANFYPGILRRRIENEVQPNAVENIVLLIKRPGQEDAIIQEQAASTLDILPTMAAELGVSLSMRTSGRNLFLTTTNEFQAPSSEILKANNPVLLEKIKLFGTGSKDKLYLLGPSPNLLAISTSDIQSTRSDVALGYELDRQEYLDNLNPNIPIMPAWLTGTLTGFADVNDPVDLLIAINGTIVATTTSYPEDERKRFSAIIPEESLREGHNELLIYQIVDDQENYALELLNNVRSNSFSYTDNSFEQIQEQTGELISIAPEQIKGHVNAIQNREEFIRLGGWGFEADSGEPIDLALLDIAGQIRYTSRPTEPREDISLLSGNVNTRNFGFLFTLFDSDLDMTGPIPISVIGVREERATVIASWNYLSSNFDNAAERAFLFNSDGTRIISADGEFIAEFTDSNIGNIDQTTRTEGLLEIIGWAGSEEIDSVDYYLLEHKGALRYLGAIKNHRPDVGQTFNNSALEYSGFRFLVEESLLADFDMNAVRILAITDERAVTVNF